jgi:hypothetical protein
MTSLLSLKREVELLHRALIVPVKPKPKPTINFDELTDVERATLLRAEEILTDHELNPRVKPFCIHGAIPEVFEEYNMNEKQLILDAYNIYILHQQQVNVLGAF